MSNKSASNVLDKSERSTLSAADWERAALELISEKGVQALAVEPLARRMGITKGSFYWHFLLCTFHVLQRLLLNKVYRWCLVLFLICRLVSSAKSCL